MSEQGQLVFASAKNVFAESVDLLHMAQVARNLRKLAAHALQVLADVPQFICNFPQQSDNFLADPTDAGDDERTKNPEQPFQMGIVGGHARRTLNFDSNPRRGSSFIARVTILCSTGCSASSVGAGRVS